MNINPIDNLRSSLEEMLEGAAFQYDIGNTRSLVRKAQKVLDETTPSVVSERPVGIFRYDPTSGAFKPVEETEAMDKQGNLREGYEYLFRKPDMRASTKRH